MAAVSMKVLGVTEARRLFSPGKVRRTIAAALDQLVLGSLQIERDAKILAPVDTDRLRSQITHEDLRIEAGEAFMRVGTNISYARFLEFGTGQRGASTELRESAEEKRQALGYRYGPKLGMTPRPFLFPAYENNREFVIARIAASAQRELERR